MKLQPIFGTFQRDGKNKNGMTMFKCLRCDRRSRWKHREHGHPDKKKEEKVEE